MAGGGQEASPDTPWLLAALLDVSQQYLSPNSLSSPHCGTVCLPTGRAVNWPPREQVLPAALRHIHDPTTGLRGPPPPPRSSSLLALLLVSVFPAAAAAAGVCGRMDSATRQARPQRQ